MKIRTLSTLALVIGLASGLSAGSTQASADGPHAPDRELRAKAKRPPPTPEQATFLEAHRALRDSLGSALGAYSKAVRDGAEPRSLTTERQRVAEAKARLDRHRTENLETWLDVAAYHPGPGGRPFHRGEGRKHRRKGNPPTLAPSDSTVAP